MRILVVEDEDNIRKLMKMNLELEGYDVTDVAGGKKVFRLCNEQHFDLIILDIMLPEISGLDICEQIRLSDQETPIIFVTAKNSPMDKVLGLKRGADDYITKPFHLEELLLRVKNVLKRTAQEQVADKGPYHFGENWVNFRTFEAYGTAGVFQLTSKEAKILKLLIERRHQAVSRQQILQAVWGYDVFPTTRTVDNFILALRKYFEPDPSNPRYFLSIRSVGYKFVNEHG